MGRVKIEDPVSEDVELLVTRPVGYGGVSSYDAVENGVHPPTLNQCTVYNLFCARLRVSSRTVTFFCNISLRRKN